MSLSQCLLFNSNDSEICETAMCPIPSSKQGLQISPSAKGVCAHVKISGKLCRGQSFQRGSHTCDSSAKLFTEEGLCLLMLSNHAECLVWGCTASHWGGRGLQGPYHSSRLSPTAGTSLSRNPRLPFLMHKDLDSIQTGCSYSSFTRMSWKKQSAKEKEVQEHSAHLSSQQEP